MAATPIATMADGTILYSDGSRRAPASFNPYTPATGTRYISTPINSGKKNTTTTSSSSGGTTSSSGTYIDPRQTDEYKKKFSSILSGLEGDVDKYIGELLNVAQGDYDFVAKWIENNYKEALGTDDTARAEFFKSVANDTEKRVGRIAYDYQTGTYRTQQDRNLALTRLKEDEKVLTEKLTTQRMLDREAQNTTLNQRGLMEGGTRETTDGLAGKSIAQLEEGYMRDFDALSRSVNRDTYDINLGADRRLEDLTTTARRSGEDAEQQRTYGLEQAGNTLAAEKARLERERFTNKQALPGIADNKTLRELGYA